MKHMKWALALAGALSALAAATPALAKETTRLALFPAHPRAGRLTTVQLRPYLYLGGTDLRPRLVDADHKWNVSAFSTRTGQSVPVRLHRNVRNPYVWSAKLRFGSAGWWSLYSGLFNAPLDVRVRPRGQPSIWERLERPFHTPTVRPRFQRRSVPYKPLIHGHGLGRRARLSGRPRSWTWQTHSLVRGSDLPEQWLLREPVVWKQGSLDLRPGLRGADPHSRGAGGRRKRVAL